MAINTYISMIESKRKLSKQEEERQNHGYGEGFDGYQMGGNVGKWVKLRIKSIIWNIRKQKTTMQNSKKKKESNKMRIV